MEALKRLTLAFAVVALGGIGCGDDDGDDGPSTNLDASVGDAALDGTVVVRNDGSAGDAGALECPSYTLPTATQCGGNHCKETPAQLRANVSATAVCKAEAELNQFCQLSSVQKVTQCVTTAFTSGATDLKGATKSCSATALPDYTSACLDCFVDSAICAAQKCLSVCYPNSATAACDQCRATNCIPAFYTCSGIKSPL